MATEVVKNELGTIGNEIPINIFSNKPHPVTLPDEEYPDWLWECNTFLDLYDYREMEEQGIVLTKKQQTKKAGLMRRQAIKKNNTQNDF